MPVRLLLLLSVALLEPSVPILVRPPLLALLLLPLLRWVPLSEPLIFSFDEALPCCSASTTCASSSWDS